jgi:hypothetical protein
MLWARTAFRVEFRLNTPSKQPQQIADTGGNAIGLFVRWFIAAFRAKSAFESCICHLELGISAASALIACPSKVAGHTVRVWIICFGSRSKSSEKYCLTMP